MGNSEIVNATRTTRRLRVLGTDVVCERCGWSDASALTKTDDRILCYECRSLELGKDALERHHHLGRAVDPATVSLPGNVHRDLSDQQRAWPELVRTNPQRDPLLWLAAALLGLRDHLSWWTSWVDRIAHWLIAVYEALQVREGERWWEPLGVPPVWQGAPS